MERGSKRPDRRTRRCERACSKRATLAVVDDADHTAHVRARSGRDDAQALAEMLDTTAGWLRLHRE